MQSYLRRKQVTAAPGAAEMVAECVGADLNRLASELDKLLIALPEGERVITTQLVQQHIALTRDFNVYELLDAVGQKDLFKVNRMVKYFYDNSKDVPRTLSSLFTYFSNLMLSFYAPDKSLAGLASWLGMTEWQVKKNVLPGMRLFSGMKVMQILGEIRRTDARLKGSEGSHTSAGDLMKELMFFILH